MPFRHLRTGALAALAAAFWAFAACAADIFVIGGKLDHPFWSIVRRGVADAQLTVEAGYGSVTWMAVEDYQNIGENAARLIRDAVASGADGIVAGLWDPEPMEPAFREAVDAGIPVLIYNAGGIEAADRIGALAYVGSNAYENGRVAGRHLAAGGLTHVICINTFPTLDNTSAMCRGLDDSLAAAGGQVVALDLPESSFGEQEAVSDAAKQALLANPGIDAVMTVGNLGATAASEAIARAGKAGAVQLGSFDLDDRTLDRIRSGHQLFAVDQQAYFQGFLAVSLLNAYVNLGMVLPQREILTGPGIVDRTNIDVVEKSVKMGAR